MTFRLSNRHGTAQNERGASCEGIPGTSHDLDILIVEDNATEALDVCSLLKESRYRSVRLHLASDAESASAMARSQCFDLVVTDFWLGNTTAASLVNDISRTAPHLPVIVLSGLSRDVLSMEDAAGSLYYLSRRDLSAGMLETAISTALAGAG